MIKAYLMWQVGLIANIKLHFFLAADMWSGYNSL